MDQKRQAGGSGFSRRRGFQSAGRLVQSRIASAGEARGFAVARLLTHWSEVVGEDIARLCTPVKVGYARKGGLGATLTLRIGSAAGPLIQAQSEIIRARVNACYGYNAIARLRFEQTALGPGFGEPAAVFAPKPPRSSAPAPSPEVTAATGTVADPGLRDALRELGALIHDKETRK